MIRAWTILQINKKHPLACCKGHYPVFETLREAKEFRREHCSENRLRIVRCQIRVEGSR